MKKKTNKKVVGKKSTEPARVIAHSRGTDVAHAQFDIPGVDAFFVGKKSEIEALPKIEAFARIMGDLSQHFQRETQELANQYGIALAVTPVFALSKLPKKKG